MEIQTSSKNNLIGFMLTLIISLIQIPNIYLAMFVMISFLFGRTSPVFPTSSFYFLSIIFAFVASFLIFKIITRFFKKSISEKTDYILFIIFCLFWSLMYFFTYGQPPGVGGDILVIFLTLPYTFLGLYSLSIYYFILLWLILVIPRVEHFYLSKNHKNLSKTSILTAVVIYVFILLLNIIEGIFFGGSAGVLSIISSTIAVLLSLYYLLGFLILSLIITTGWIIYKHS